MKTHSRIPKLCSLLVFLMFFFSIVNSQLVLAEQFTFKYDSAGNMVKGFKYYYEYDGFNQLSKVRENDENGRILEEYWYGAEGNRIKKVHYNEDGSKETFYYIGEDFVRKINNSGTYDTNYYYLGGELVAKKENSETLFFHPDHLGSTSLITDESGDAVEKTTYLPFGAVFEGGNEEERLYTGKEKDDTGLMYYGARYYYPILMKFTQPDTLLPDIYDPQQLNRYSYARNNPYRYTDPTGNFLDIVADIGFIGYDVWTIFKNPRDWRNWAALGGDVVGAVIPFATGIGMGVRIVTKADDALKVAKAGRKGVRYADEAYEALSESRKTDSIFDAMKTMFGSKKGSFKGFSRKMPDGTIVSSHQIDHIRGGLSERKLQNLAKNTDKSFFSNKVDAHEIANDAYRSGTRVSDTNIVKEYSDVIGYTKSNGKPTNYVNVKIDDTAIGAYHAYPITKSEFLRKLKEVGR